MTDDRLHEIAGTLASMLNPEWDIRRTAVAELLAEVRELRARLDAERADRQQAIDKAVAAAREACAREVERQGEDYAIDLHPEAQHICGSIAAGLRARGERR